MKNHGTNPRAQRIERTRQATANRAEKQAERRASHTEVRVLEDVPAAGMVTVEWDRTTLDEAFLRREAHGALIGAAEAIAKRNGHEVGSGPASVRYIPIADVVRVIFGTPFAAPA